MEWTRRRITNIRREEKEGGNWPRQIGGRSQWSWRSTSIPSMSSIQVSFNIRNGQMAPDTVNDQDALAFGSKQSKQFSVSLSSNVHTSIKRKVKSMVALKKVVIVKGKLIYDVETLFSRLLVLGQQHSVDVAEIFQFELNSVPTALIDE